MVAVAWSASSSAQRVGPTFCGGALRRHRDFHMKGISMNRAITFASASLLVAFGFAILSDEAEAGRRRNRNCCQQAVYSGYSGHQFQAYYTSAGGYNSYHGDYGAHLAYGNQSGVTYQHTTAYPPGSIASCAPQAAAGTSTMTGNAPVDAPPQPSVIDPPSPVPAPGK